MDVNKLLDELEDMLEGHKFRLGDHALFLNIEEVVNILQQIRASLPQQIQKADQITRDRERILNEAREQADRMVTEAAEQAELTIRQAQEESRILVSNHEITRQAQQEGQRLVEMARQEADAIRQGALEYAHDVLDKLNNSVLNLAHYVSQAQQVAQKARDEVKL